MGSDCDKPDGESGLLPIALEIVSSEWKATIENGFTKVILFSEDCLDLICTKEILRLRVVHHKVSYWEELW